MGEKCYDYKNIYMFICLHCKNDINLPVDCICSLVIFFNEIRIWKYIFYWQKENNPVQKAFILFNIMTGPKFAYAKRYGFFLLFNSFFDFYFYVFAFLLHINYFVWMSLPFTCLLFDAWWYPISFSITAMLYDCLAT